MIDQSKTSQELSLELLTLQQEKSDLQALYDIDITDHKKAEKQLVVANKELAFQNQEKEKRAAELMIANEELLYQNKEKEKRAAELIIANKELAFQNKEKERRAAELIIANKELLFQNEEKEKRAAELIVANEELAFQNQEKEKRASELIIANKELLFQNEEKEKRAGELIIANKELAFQNEEKERRAGELVIANKELIFQHVEKEKRAAELIIADKELLFQNKEKGKRVAELIIANKELLFQNDEKEKRAAELNIANKELAFQNSEKEKRASELIVANKELAFQNEEKENRAAELIVANKELLFQNEEKEQRAAELIIANNELAFQNTEKEKRAAELFIANKELEFQNEQKERRAAELIIANKELVFQHVEKEKRAAELIIANKELQFQNQEKEKRAAELVIANEARRETNEYLESLLNCANAPIIVWNTEYKITRFNKAFETLTGRTEKEVLGKSLAILYPTNERDASKEQMRETLEGGCMEGAEIKVQHLDGSIGILLWNSANIMSPDGKSTIATIAQGHDITSRKIAEKALRESEANLKEAQMLARLGNWEFDLATQKIVWSEQVYRLYERDPSLGTPSIEEEANYYTPEQDRKLKGYVEQCMVGPQSEVSYEFIATLPSGKTAVFAGTTRCIKNDSGEIIKFFGTLQDITLRKKAENEIFKLNATLEQKVIERTTQLETANCELEAFSYSISHDLRAPLRHIGGFIDLLTKNNAPQLNETGLRYLKIISDSSVEMGNLIDALLAFSRLSRAELKRTRINSNKMVASIFKISTDELGTRDLELNISDLPDVMGDQTLINQVWVNLISNALKYTRNKEKTCIAIGSESQDEKTVFYIRDNGAGFDMKYADKLFGVFQRLHKAKDFEGIGIGLANVNRIITRHGGQCWARSEIDQGATFFFSIPNN